VTTPVLDDQGQMELLYFLYKRQVENPKFSSVDRAIIQDAIKWSWKEIELNISHLQEKNLISLSGGEDSRWVFAKITPEGVNLIENKNLVVNQNAPNNFSGQSTDTFKQARDEIRETRLSNSQKEKIEKHLRSLEAELGKNRKADLGKIQKICVELNRNAYEINPAVSKAILETVKFALNLQT